MQPEDRMQLAEAAVEAAGGRVDLIDHIGAVDLKTAVKLARHAGEVGMDAISSVPPFFYGYGEKEIAQYYKAIAEASGLPVIMYASPLAGTKITWEMVDRLMDIDGMVGVKWTNYDYFEMHRIKQLRGGNINVINGPDETLLCGLSMGADGGIGTTYNVMPKVFMNIYRYFTSGDINAAQKEQFKADKLIALLCRFNVLSAMKELLFMMGYDCGYCTYPLNRLTMEERKAFRSGLDSLHFEEEYL
jgi:N-acetylneuraminate lyase